MVKKGLSLVLVILCLALAVSALATGNSAVLPNDLQKVEEEAFAGNTALEALVVPASVQEIGSRAFAECSNLTSVTFESMDVKIAGNAFDETEVSFRAYPGSTAEAYALAHGIQLTLLGEKEEFSGQALGLVIAQGKPESGLMGEVLASERLLVQMSTDVLPNISAYEPERILSEGTGFFVIQFASIAQASECFDFLEQRVGQDVEFVEPDAFVTVDYTASGEVSAASLNEKWPDSDPMGLETYSEYIRRKYPGASATVAVVDSGVANHSALNGHVLAGYDFTGQNNPRYDANNHGTSVAGTIVDAVYGANVKIIPVRVFGGEFQTTLMIRQAVQQAVRCHPDVINISSIFSESAAVRSLLSRAGCPVVVSAGNDNSNCDSLFPAGMSGVITVSSIDTNMTKAAHSNYGSSVDYCAPGTNIAGYTSTGGTYNDFTGTSYAAPQISAAIALLSMDPEHSLSDMKATCKDLGAPGRDQYYGNGLPYLPMLCDKVVRIDVANEIPTVLQVGGVGVLTYQVLPESAENKSVSITSSDDDVLLVNKTTDGVLQLIGNKKGTAHVTITAEDGSGVSVSTQDITVVQPVLKISIDATTHEVNLAKAGETLGLSVSVMPTDASSKQVIWSSDNEEIATVAQNGVVTPVAVGKTIIRAEAADKYGACGEFEVEVVSKKTPDTIGISKTVPEVVVGETLRLDLIVEPEDAIRDVTWYCTNTDFAEVSKDGVVTGKASGRVYIMATSMMDPTVQAACELIIVQPPVEVVLTAEEGAAGILDAGKSLQLTGYVLPRNADNPAVMWESSNEAIATVDETGKVYGVSSGETVITVSSEEKPELKKEYALTVRLLPDEISITGDDYVYPDATKQLTAVVNPTNADDTSVTWTSKNPEIVTVTNTGVIRGISEGVGVIEIRSNAVPELTATFTVNVYPEWTYSDWVTADLLPSNGIVTDRKWTYTETTSSTNSNLSGWTKVGEEWRQTGTGSKEYASFPGTFNTSHWLYSSLNGSPYDGYDNGSSKRTVSNTHAGWIYWHWAYNAAYANRTDRWISDRNQIAGSSRGLSNFAYTYFYAFNSTTDFPALSGFSYTWGANAKYVYMTTYNCSSHLPGGADTSSTSGLNNPRFLRMDYYRSTYTDYVKYYNYKREMTVTTEPTASSTISNITAYVKYKTPNTNGIQLSGWVTEANVPSDAEIVETRWSYKETISNNSPTMDGWELVGSEWRQTGSGAVRWADFGPISGFDHSNSLYSTYNKSVPSAYENTTAKRVINSTSNDGYIYWHWMYSVSSNAYDRAIFYKYGTGSGTLTGNNYVYKYFGAFESGNQYPQISAGSNWGQNDTYYLWYKVTDRSSNADTQGSWYWYRTQIYKTAYTDYIKQFTYSRNVITATQPTAGSTISDITKYVRYIKKK